LGFLRSAARFGLNATVTAGIISAKDRAGIGQQFQRFLQTDAAINPGNSGGPLVDMAGQVIGINTAIITGSRGYEGVGFAMPSSTALSVYDQLIKSGPRDARLDRRQLSGRTWHEPDYVEVAWRAPTAW